MNLLLNVWERLGLGACDAAAVDHVSLWRADHQTAHLLATSLCHSQAKLWKNIELSQNPIIIGLLRGESYQGPASGLQEKAPGFLYVQGIPGPRGGEKCYILSFYQREGPLSAMQVTKANIFVDIVRALGQGYLVHVTQIHRFPKGVQHVLPCWRTEERIRREIADILHGPVQTQLLLLETRVADIRKHYEDTLGKDFTELKCIEDELERLREHEVRQLSHRLHPDLISIGLGPALRSLQQSYQPILNVNLTMNGSFCTLDAPLANNIPQPLRLDIYRIVEEALANVLHYGCTRHVRISLNYEPDNQLQIEVHDDGLGFDTDRTQDDGVGIRRMRARARQWGGRLTINSDPWNGTTVKLNIPARFFSISASSP